MAAFKNALLFSVFIAMVLPPGASAIVESKSGTEYPDEITVDTQSESVVLRATGVGLREKYFINVDVYTIVSYVSALAVLEGDKGEAVRTLNDVKRIQMDLRRGFSRDKLVNSFKDVIEKNYDDMTAFSADLDIFLAYFDRDAEEKDEIIFAWDPASGLTTTLNGEVKGVIENFDFAQALWTVWFGAKPADDGLRKDLLSEL